jgi:predicted Zn-dependent protease
MTILTKEEAKKIIDKVLSFSKADEMSVALSGGRTGNIRYARNSVSTSGESYNLSLSITAVFGKRSGTSTINEFDDKSLEKAVRRAEEIARLAPENPEFVPALGHNNIWIQLASLKKQLIFLQIIVPTLHLIVSTLVARKT